MANLSPGLARKNPAQLIALANLVAPKLAPTPPAPPPLPNMAAKVAALVTASGLADTANNAYEAAQSALKALKQKRDQAADALRDAHKVVVSAAESEANGDPVLLAETGHPLAAAPTPGALPGMIHNLSLTAGDAEQHLDVHFDPEEYSKTYDVQLTTVDPLAGPYATVAQPTASKVMLTGLTSGGRVWVRVRGVGPKGAGPWSDPATKIVP